MARWGKFANNAIHEFILVAHPRDPVVYGEPVQDGAVSDALYTFIHASDVDLPEKDRLLGCRGVVRLSSIHAVSLSHGAITGPSALRAKRGGFLAVAGEPGDGKLDIAGERLRIGYFT